MLRDLMSSGSLKKSSFLKKKSSFSHKNTAMRSIQYMGYVT